MDKKPLFSLIVANYNNGRFLPKLIETVLLQTYTNWELIIVDDKSTDGSVEILQAFLNERIRLIQHPINQGAGAAFRTAAAYAQGEIIGMLGADDGLVEDALAIIIKSYELFPKASTIYSKCFYCDEFNLEIKEIFQYSRGNIENKSVLFDASPLNFNFQTFTREAYLKTPGFDRTLSSAIDQDIFLKLEEVGNTFFMDQPLYYYRIHENGISQSKRNFSKLALNLYRVKINAFYRRRNTGIPNLSEQEARLLEAERFFYLSFILRQQKNKNIAVRIKSFYYIIRYLQKAPTFKNFKIFLNYVIAFRHAIHKKIIN